MAVNFPVDESECGPLTRHSGGYYRANYDELNERVKAYVSNYVKDLILKQEDLSTCVSLFFPHSIVLTRGGYFSGKDIRVALNKPLLENVKAILSEKNINRLFCIFYSMGVSTDGWTVAFIQHGAAATKN